MGHNIHRNRQVGRAHRPNCPCDHQLFIVGRHNQRQANLPLRCLGRPAGAEKIALTIDSARFRNSGVANIAIVTASAMIEICYASTLCIPLRTAYNCLTQLSLRCITECESLPLK